jgi:hypothetical protein
MSYIEARCLQRDSETARVRIHSEIPSGGAARQSVNLNGAVSFP